MGVLAANGTGLPAFWDSLIAGRSGIRTISLFDATEYDVHVAGEIKDFDLHYYLNGRFKPKRLGRHTQLALVATKLALEHAGLTEEELRQNEPVSIAMGISTSAIDVIERGKEALINRGPQTVSPYTVSSCQPHAVSAAISEMLGVSTRCATLSSACPAGMDAFAYGAELIRSGKTDLAIVGGADAPITPLTMASLSLAGLAPNYSFPPEQCSRPFELNRKGGVISEGACIMVLESLNHALGRGAFPWAEILGFGNVADDHGAESGFGLEFSMQEALANAGMMPSDIEYISAHGPSHPVIDRAETEAIKRVFKKHAGRMPVSSIKGSIGNPLAAAGPLQIAACAMGMRENLIAPTINYETPDPACDLDYVPNRPYSATIDRAMVNVHGLGGGNSSLVMGRVKSA